MNEQEPKTFATYLIEFIVLALFIIGIVATVQADNQGEEYATPCHGTFYDC